MIELLSLCFASSLLIYACYSDVKRRMVSNWLWVLMVGVGAPLSIYKLLIRGLPFLIPLSSSIIITFSLSYLFFRLHLFGGADAKCLMSLSVLIPEQPRALAPALAPALQLPFPFALTTLLNAALISLLAPLSIFLYNLLKLHPEELRANLRLAFIGYKLPTARLGDVKHRHVRLMHQYEECEGEGMKEAPGHGLHRNFVFGGVEIEKGVIEKLRAHGVGEVWVTPELPFMLFITAGFFTAILYGNLFFCILSHL